MLIVKIWCKLKLNEGWMISIHSWRNKQLEWQFRKCVSTWNSRFFWYCSINVRFCFSAHLLAHFVWKGHQALAVLILPENNQVRHHVKDIWNSKPLQWCGEVCTSSFSFSIEEIVHWMNFNFSYMPTGNESNYWMVHIYDDFSRAIEFVPFRKTSL